jgi:hypothetical protein
MVKSILDTRIDYKEIRGVDMDDIDFDANLYETKVYNHDIIFALGKVKYTYIDNNIVYYPMYLLENDRVKMQIGLYEILASAQSGIFDEEGDIDLNKFDKPLLYSFTLAEIGKGQAPAQQIQAQQIQEPVKGKKGKTPTQLWIQSFMNDPGFGLIDTKYDGNCFFNMLRLALEENDQNISVDEMRDVLAANVTEELFQNYKSLYEDLKTNETNLTREIKNITGRFNALQAKMKTIKDRNLQLSFSKQSEEMEKKHTTLKNDRAQTKANMHDFEFMKGIDNLAMLKLKMKTNEYWADTWAISTLEREMNIKIIIFSELNYREGDEINTLQCGQLNDTVLEQIGKFEPSYYVMAAHHGGYHYQMITYNTQRSFTFNELPTSVVTLIKEKCMEKMAGPYTLIPEFSALVQAPVEAAQQAPVEAAQQAPVEATQQPPVEAAAVTETLSDLYDNATVFRFYSKSANKPLPGKGEGEQLGPEGREAYAELARIPEWRKKLSNGWSAEFKLDGHKWLTAEHYYQASKFKKNNRAFYLQFSLDAKESSIAKDVVLAKAAGGKSGKLKTEQLRAKDITLDSDFYKPISGSKFTRGEMEMENALRAKFTQNADLKVLLMATKKARLEHITSGKPAEVVNDLMRVRRELQQTI